MAQLRGFVPVDEHMRIALFLRFQFLQLHGKFIGGYRHLVEKEAAILRDAEGGEIGQCLCRAGAGRGQRDVDAMVLHHAEAHHDERGQEKENDVNQRHDFYPRSALASR